MADNKVNFLRGTSAEYEAAIKDNDTFYYTTDDGKLYLGNKEITGGGASGGESSADIENHNNSETAHPSILSQISEVKNRLLTLEAAIGAGVTANPFAVTFGNLDGITANAVWNADEARLEF